VTLLSARDLCVRPGSGPAPSAGRARGAGSGGDPPKPSDAVIRGLSIEVAPGEWVAVTGPNGGGKTTLLLALAGLWPIERGAVELEGRPIARWAQVRGAFIPAARVSVAAIL